MLWNLCGSVDVLVAINYLNQRRSMKNKDVEELKKDRVVTIIDSMLK